MKKFTLMMIATFVAVSGMAIGTQKHAVVKNFMNKNMMTPYFAKKVDVSGGIAASQSKANTIKQLQQSLSVRLKMQNPLWM